MVTVFAKSDWHTDEENEAERANRNEIALESTFWGDFEYMHHYIGQLKVGYY